MKLILSKSQRQSIKSISQVMFPSYRGYMASVELGSEDIRKVRKKWFLSKRLLCGIDIYRYIYVLFLQRCKIFTESQEELLSGEDG